VLPQSLRVTPSSCLVSLCSQRPCLLFIFLACQDLPSKCLSNALDCPSPHYPHHIFYSHSCPPFSPSSPSIIHHSDISRQISWPLPAPHDMSAYCLIDRSTRRRTRVFLDRLGEGKEESRMLPCYHRSQRFLIYRLVPSLPLVIFLSHGLFLSSRSPQDSTPLHSYLVLRFPCPSCPLV